MFQITIIMYRTIQVTLIYSGINENLVSDTTKGMEGYLSKKSIHINESFVHAIALILW